jgi:hypothetical protein
MTNETIHFFAPPGSFAPTLGVMARGAFFDTFAQLYDPGPFQQFLEESYGPGGKMARDFADPCVRWKLRSPVTFRLGDRLDDDRIWRKQF